ncbi:MAG: hypothetical protein EXS08_07015 [Planctomycetes bacterium]|nr:hypothetical protein [Planctomycetota bacterium]
MSLTLQSALLLATLSLSAAPVREDVELRWRGKVGDVQRHRSESKQEFKTPMGPMTTTYAMVVRQEVKAVSPAGVGSLELRFEAFKISSAGMLPMDFDSTRSGEAAQQNPPDISGQFATLSAATVKLEIEPSGRVAKIEGLNEARDRAFGLARPAMAGMGGPVRGLFSDEALKRLVEVNAFPPAKVAVGASWPRTQELKAEMLGTLKFTSENKLVGLEQRGAQACARIELSGEITLDSSGGGGMSFTLDDSDYLGSALVALDSGYLLELSTKSVLDLALAMGENAQEMTVQTEQKIVALTAHAPAFE